MKPAFAVLSLAILLAACGADGAPIAPKYSAETSIGYNSKTGPFSQTKLGVCFGSSC